MTDLFADINAMLAQRREVLEGRARLHIASERSKWERDLWRAISPFVQSDAEFRAAASFMARMTRERSRD